MADKLNIEELLKEKKILEENIVKDIEQDIKKFYTQTGFGLRSITVGVNKDNSEIQYVICEIALE